MTDYKVKYDFNIDYNDTQKSEKESHSKEANDFLNNNLSLESSESLSNKNSINLINISGNLPNYSETKTNNYTINDDSDSLNIIAYREKLSDFDKYKVKVDNLTKYQLLLKRIYINKKIITLFLENYYLDDFNNTRRGFYFLFSIPFVTFFGFAIMNPFHPLRKVCFFMTLLGSGAFTTISFRNEMALLGTKQNSLGSKVI